MDPALAALLGMALGGVITYFTSSRLQKREEERERRGFLVGKVEETYQAAMSVREAYRIAWGEMTGQLAKGEFGQLRDLKKVEMERVRMLVELYFPDLESKLDLLEQEARKFGTAVADAIAATEDSLSTRQRLQVPLFERHRSLDAACTNFLKAVAQTANDYLMKSTVFGGGSRSNPLGGRNMMR